MSGDWRPKQPRKRAQGGKQPKPAPIAPEPPPVPSEWMPTDVAPAGKFRVVTFGRVNFEEPTSAFIGDFDMLPFAKQHAIDLNREAVLKANGNIHAAWVLNDAGGIEFNPYVGRVSHRRPLAVTSIAGLQREESRKPVTPIKRK